MNQYNKLNYKCWVDYQHLENRQKSIILAFLFHLFYFSIHPSQNIFGGLLILVGYRLSGVFAGKLTSGVFATLTSGDF